MTQKDTRNFFGQFLRGAVHYGVGGTMAKALVFVNVFLILAMMSPYQYGVYKLAFSVFVTLNGLLFSGVSGLVLNDIVHYRSAGESVKGRRLFYEFAFTKLVLGAGALLIFFFGADAIGSYYSEGIGLYLKIFSVLFLTDAIVSVADIFLKSKLDFFGSNVIPIASELAKLAFLAYFGFVASEALNIAQLAVATVVGSIASVLVVSLYIWLRHSPSLHIPRRSGNFLLVDMMRTYGKWGIAKNYISTFVDNMRLWLVKIFVSTEAVAIFSVAASLATAAKKAIPIQSIASLIPLYAKDPSALKDIYLRSTKYFIWLFFGMVIASFIAVPLLVPIVFPKYVASIPFFKVIIFAVVFNAMALNKQVVYSLRRQRFLFFLPIIELMSTALFGFILIPRFGLYGTSTELIITEGILFSVIYWYLIRIQPQLAFKWGKLFTFDRTDSAMLKELWHKFGRRLKLTD